MSLERLKVLNDQIDRNLTVYALLAEGVLRSKSAGVTIAGSSGSEAKVVFTSDSVSVLIGSYKPDESWPMHSHYGILEYLISVKGRFEITCIHPYGETRMVLDDTECFRVPQGVPHMVHCKDGGTMLGICLPPERGYESVPEGTHAG